jgi:hypothetical protein
MPAEHQKQHHHPTKKPIESDVPDGKGGAYLFDQQVEDGEQQCGGQHEQGAGNGGIHFDLLVSILDILDVFLRLKPSSALILTELQHFETGFKWGREFTRLR